MALLENHLEQISLSSTAIAELSFPPPKMFTNALLHSHDITALIRDTEAHERALFTLASPKESSVGVSRRRTVHGLGGSQNSLTNGVSLIRAPRHESAVATLLGGALGEEVRKSAIYNDGRERGEVDVDVLLKGAEKLCGVYPIPGAPERIASLRTRYEKLSSSIARNELRVSRQTTQLAKMNRSNEDNDDDDNDEDEEEDIGNEDATMAANEEIHVTPDQLRREEEEIRELEKKKRGLEDRISGMDRDLGGLLR